MLCRVLTVIGALLLTAYSSTGLANDTFDNPRKQFEIKLKKFNQSPKILVPGYYLHTLTEGEHKRSNWGAHAKAHYYVTNLSPALGSELATELHRDLVEKLRATGWEVLTWDDVADLDWSSLGEQPALKQIGLPGFKYNVGFGNTYFMTSVPEGMPVMKSPKMGVPGAPDLFKMLKIAAPTEANILYPNLRFDAPLGYGDKGSGYKNTYAEAKVAPVLELAWADAGSMTKKAAASFLRLRQPVRLSENIGTLTEVSSETQEDLALFTYDTFRSVARGEYSFRLDLDAYRAAVLKAGRDFNSLLVAELQAALPTSG
jgi:hypothetical protein